MTLESSGRGRLLDDHELSMRARAYAGTVLEGDRWPLSAVDLSLVDWETSAHARRRNGRCRYDSAERCTISISRHVYEEAGFESCRETVRHELVHAWQHQHRGKRAVSTDDGAVLVDGPPSADTFTVEPGHGPSFKSWVGPLNLSGRCSSPYERVRGDYNYVAECPDCGEWWGRFRLCKTVRQAAHGRVGPAGYRYCTDCETLIHLRDGDLYLDHASHDDAAIRAFADGNTEAAPTTPIDRLEPASR